MNEPDRPRRDVSIEEAERMPMTDEELPSPNAGDLMVYETMALYLRRRGDHAEALAIDALVAEVRRLRGELEHIRAHPCSGLRSVERPGAFEGYYDQE